MDNTIQQEMYKIRGEPRMKPEKHHGLRNLQKTYQRRLKKQQSLKRIKRNCVTENKGGTSFKKTVS